MWCQGAEAFNVYGRPVRGHDSSAVKWSLTGACEYLFRRGTITVLDLIDFRENFLNLYNQSLWAYNDTHTFLEIEQMLLKMERY